MELLAGTWLFPAFFLASLLHMTEEYLIPGGFIDAVRRHDPRLTRALTPIAAVVINGLQLVLCVFCIVVGTRLLAFSLSIAALVLINALVHLAAAVRARGYAPGLGTSLVLYMPLSLYAYGFFLSVGALSAPDMVTSLALGALYQLVPIAYFAASAALRPR